MEQRIPVPTLSPIFWFGAGANLGLALAAFIEAYYPVVGICLVMFTACLLFAAHLEKLRWAERMSHRHTISLLTGEGHAADTGGAARAAGGASWE